MKPRGVIGIPVYIFKAILLSLLLAATACASSHGAGPHGRRARKAAAAPVKPTPPPAQGGLKLAEAERYMLALINYDRAVEGLDEVEWDPTAAKAGLAHAKDMAGGGFTAHIGTDGSTPESRYTDAGGMDVAFENAGCLADAKARELDPDPRFEPAGIEKVQAAFMAEKPPHDGHRKNILKPSHTHVGVGLAKVKGVSLVCMAQEFVARYGSYAALPRQAKRGERVKVSGSISPPASFAGVGIARIELPSSRKPSELLKTGSYAIPAPFVTYFAKEFVTPIPVEVKGNEFSIEVPLSDNRALPAAGRPGLYEVSVWARLPDSNDAVMVSLRTVRVR